MKRRFQRIGILAKRDDPAVQATLATVMDVLRGRALDVIVDGPADPDSGYRFVLGEEVAAGRDLVITIGGDGTLLRAAQMAFPRQVPLLGVNLGRLGFLADLSAHAVATELDAILGGDFVEEARGVLECEILRDGSRFALSHALNDVVIQRWSTARLITLNTFVDGRFVHTQRSDGMIVSTPTGSTAYALSGGGPILFPALRAIVLVPVCPHTLTNRPIVLDDRACIEIDIATERGDDSRVTCDGNPLPSVQSGDRIRITRHGRDVTLIHPKGHDHFATLRAKLQWGQGPC